MSYSREHWSSKVGFIFAALGSAVGLGLLWKFPYTIGENGGGLFLLAYFICLFVVGIPIFIGELILGRTAQKAAILCYETLDEKGKNSHWKIAGWFGVLSSFLIMSFYSVIAGYGMSYVLMSLNGFHKGLSISEVANLYNSLSSSGGISLLWHFLFTLITMGIVFAGVRKGIEYWAKLMTRSLLIILAILFLYSLTLKGFPQAAKFVFYPNVESFKFSSVLEALGLAFWTLSIGQGIMISYGSYMQKGDSIPKLAAVVAFGVIVVAILAALTIFPVVFTFGLKPEEGTGLIFKTLPFLFAQLPGSLVISTVFFILFVFTALTSAIPLVEVVTSNIMELKNVSRHKAVLITCLGTFIVGIPSAYAGSKYIFPQWQSIYGNNFLDTVNNLVSIWIIPIGGFISALFMGWVLDPKIAKMQFQVGSCYSWLFYLWRFFIKFIVPLTIFLIMLQKSGLFDFDKLQRIFK